MKKPRTVRTTQAKSLAEQKSDFTAEGSPPPGKVATAVPVGADKPRPAARKRAPAGRGG